MPEMTAKDWAQFGRAVQLRDRCREAAIAANARFDDPITFAQANTAYDAMVDLIRADERERMRAEGGQR